MKLGHRPALDGIRGVAILTVVFYHYLEDRYIPGGYLGVDLFFVLSGFLITAILVEEWNERGRISLRDFYRRRALRLFPALATMLSVALVLAAFASGIYREELIRFVAVSALYVANVVAALHVPIYSSFTWSLAAEEQFYIVWPIVLIWLLGRGARSGRIAAGLVAAAGVSWLLAVAAVVDGRHPYYVSFFPLTHAEPILIGCAAGVTFAAGLLPRVHPAVGTAGLAVWGAGVLTVGAFASASVTVAVPVAALGAVLAICAALEPGRLLGWLTWQPLRYVGSISYAMYLWNTIVFHYLHGGARVLGIPATIAIAAVSRRAVELPFLQMKRRRHAPPPPVSDTAPA